MGEVFYSSMKFKKNLRQGTAATQDEDVTYSEVKIINPTTSNTVCHCGSAGSSGQSSHPYRRAAVCLGLLCALLLAATLVLCVLYTSQSGNYSMLETDLEKLRSNCSTTNNEKVHQQSKYSMLARELEELRTSCNTMNEEKVQQQRMHNAIFKKLPFLEQYCPSSSQKSAACSSCTGRVCEPCPQGWEQFSSKCYYFSNLRKDWTDSRSDCIKRGADLVIIESEAEQWFITNITSKTPYHTWIGLSRSEFKSNWLWVDETPLQKGFWGSEKPAYQNGFDCALIGTEKNAWEAYLCSNKEQWICETNALLP